MLHLLYSLGEDDYRLSGDGWFEHQLDLTCLNNEFSKRVVLEIDKSEVVSENLIISPILGAIPPSMISGGSKTLITMMYDPSVKFDLAAMGDNCFRFLAEICSIKDIFVCSDGLRLLYKNGFYGDIYIDNNDTIVKCDLDLAIVYDEVKQW